LIATTDRSPVTDAPSAWAMEVFSSTLSSTRAPASASASSTAVHGSPYTPATNATLFDRRVRTSACKPVAVEVGIDDFILVQMLGAAREHHRLRHRGGSPHGPTLVLPDGTERGTPRTHRSLASVERQTLHQSPPLARDRRQRTSHHGSLRVRPSRARAPCAATQRARRSRCAHGSCVRLAPRDLARALDRARPNRGRRARAPLGTTHLLPTVVAREHLPAQRGVLGPGPADRS
jgi:hypothetical protein